MGPDPLDTSAYGASAGGLRVYGRRLAYQNGTLFFRDNQFIADSNSDWIVGPDPDLVNPTVSLHQVPHPGFSGRFFIAWNAEKTFTEPAVIQRGVRGRFFEASGVFRTSEFDVSPNEPDGHNRTLAESAQHTIAYWSKDAAYAAWTEHDAEAEVTDHVWYSAFDTGFADSIATAPTCTKGDVNGDTVVDFDDVAPFIDFLLTERVLCEAYGLIRCAVDTNQDGETNGLDVHCLVANIIGGDLNPCSQPLVADCGHGLGFGEGEGEGESMMAGGGGSGGESEEISEPEYPDPLAGLSQEEIESRWNAVVDFLENHPRENYPEMTDEEHCAMCDAAFFDIMFEGIELE